MKNPQSGLPPGFRFHPTDEELILHYLRKKVTSTPFPVSIIADVDIYKFNPWDLPAKAAFGEKEWYFFSPRDRKYPNGARPNRAAASGYWKATGTDKIIMASTMVAGGGGGMQENIGVKKALVFYKGRPPKGFKTNWIMHEYRLADGPSYNHNKPIKSKDSPMRLDHWVLCRIYEKSNVSTPVTAVISGQEQEDDEEEEQQFAQDPPPPALKSPVSHNRLNPQKSCSFSNLLDAADFSFLSNFLSDNQGTQTGFDFSAAPSNNNIGTQDQGLFTNCGNGGSGSSSYIIQKLPPLNDSSSPNMENKLKRQNSIVDEDIVNHPSKKLINSCSFTSNTTTTQPDHMPQQYNFMNHSFLTNQQLLLSPYLQFQE